MYWFGAGILWGTQKQDANGNAIAVPTPVQFGTLQEVSVDISADQKELYGQNQFPVVVGRGKGKISCKSKFAQISAAAFNTLFFGQTLAAGIIDAVYDVTGAAIPTTPYAITPTVPGSGTWSADLGVRDSTGNPMTRVDSGSTPATGQYKVTAGVYTFAAADTGKTVYISYKYTATSTSQQKQTVMNLPMGYAPTFSVDLVGHFQGKELILSLYQCVGSKLTMGTKLDDFMIPEFDFAAFADSSGKVMDWSTSD
jgi:hypothetical protein